MSQKKFLYSSAFICMAIGIMLSTGLYLAFGESIEGYFFVSFVATLTGVPALILLVLGLFASKDEGYERKRNRVSWTFLVLCGALLGVTYMTLRMAMIG